MRAHRKASLRLLIAAAFAAGLLFASQIPAAQENTEQLFLKQESDFSTPAFWMFSCPFNHMKFAISRSRITHLSRDERYDGAHSLSIAPESDETAVLWRLVTSKSGETASHVALYLGPAATGDDQSLAWALVQSCSSPKDESLMHELRQWMQKKYPRSPELPYPAPDMPLDCCHDRTG